jgi:hypothetical protein
MEHLTKLLLVAIASREALTIGFSERADQCVAVPAANLPAFIAVSAIECH